jgi:N-acetyl-gamma-glutamylphosphate reductase
MGIYEILIEEAKEKGIEKEKTDVILTAYKKGVSIELIAEIVQLSVEKVKEIIASSTDTARS